ncbi:thiamine monophosphate synthase [Nitrobacter sp. Nb-311A]|uniref:thiamine phosphate synthase n=1 Tax=unclassified Nitrobacter TaxID=2620411 RepID=UPI0000685FF4|nr:MULTISPECIES: thiamine phosphate synthase [unclassified Nitrobacter]EAQ36725.1 thiamine monophosphate synthase [Nitrobacter sp. Nb-311A]MCB1392827.1 thiamine phosphate synthase [Nitrobacter sp.]MCV0385415.1 thiamine phosphate synthase [Nitrobacter sp.]
MLAKSASLRPAPRLYLATPVICDPTGIMTPLADALASADIAAVLMRLALSDPRTMISRIKALAPLIQNSGAALLLDGHADLVARSGADGAHLASIEALQEAMPALKPDRIVGAGGLPTRHDSMVAGETGADYVLFGEPDKTGDRPSAEAIADRLAWWAELFEPPCVAHAANLDEAQLFAASGADFVLVGDIIWNDPRGAAAALADIATAIGQGYGPQGGAQRANHPHGVRGAG